MARLLGAEKSKVRLLDKRSETVMVLYYREPTTEQHLAYQNEAVKRIGQVVVDQLPEVRLKFGQEIFAGFDKGAFARIDDNGKAVEFSCDPNDPDHYDKWREHVEKHAPDILQLLATFVFESSLVAMGMGKGRGGTKTVSEDADQD